MTKRRVEMGQVIIIRSFTFHSFFFLLRRTGRFIVEDWMQGSPEINKIIIYNKGVFTIF